MQNNEVLLGMLKPMLESMLYEITHTKPENESVREQSNVLAVYLLNIPAIKAHAKGAIDAKTLAKILYNLKQSDFDGLYAAFEAAKKYRVIDEGGKNGKP